MSVIQRNGLITDVPLGKMIGALGCEVKMQGGWAAAEPLHGKSASDHVIQEEL